MTGLLPALLTLTGVLGLATGSFLNVVIWRVPNGESVVRPPSACPRCGHAIRARDNIPILSWLLLHGRCRDCKEPVSLQYPLVEAGTAALFVLIGLRFLVVDELPWALPAYLYFGAIAVPLALIDLKVRRLPDVIVLPAYPVLAVLLAVASWGSAPPQGCSALLRAGIGTVVLVAFYTLPRLVYRKATAMGLGDIKLAGVVGGLLAWVGWGAFAVGGFAAFLFGGLFGIGVMIVGGAGRKSTIPFGPWMLLGALVGLAVGEPLWSAYLGVFT